MLSLESLFINTIYITPDARIIRTAVSHRETRENNQFPPEGLVDQEKQKKKKSSSNKKVSFPNLF